MSTQFKKEFLKTKIIWIDINKCNSVNEKIRIKDEEINFEKTRQIERSLRSIVKKRLLNKQPSPQEKVLSSLTFGPYIYQTK